MQAEEFERSEYLRAALTPVITNNRCRWFRYICTILRNEADAEDVIQEAISRVLARNHPLPSEEHITLYLGRAVGNAAMEMYHRKKRERLTLIPLREEIFAAATIPTPISFLEERERLIEKEKMVTLLEIGLQRLPPKQYEALRLTILESNGLSMRDAGELNGIPYSTLRHRTNKGLRRLRKFIESNLARYSR